MLPAGPGAPSPLKVPCSRAASSGHIRRSGHELSHKAFIGSRLRHSKGPAAATFSLHLNCAFERHIGRFQTQQQPQYFPWRLSLRNNRSAAIEAAFLPRSTVNQRYRYPSSIWLKMMPALAQQSRNMVSTINSRGLETMILSIHVFVFSPKKCC